MRKIFLYVYIFPCLIGFFHFLWFFCRYDALCVPDVCACPNSWVCFFYGGNSKHQGDLRFKAPVPPTPWGNKIFVAHTQGHSCSQVKLKCVIFYVRVQQLLFCSSFVWSKMSVQNEPCFSLSNVCIVGVTKMIVYTIGIFCSTHPLYTFIHTVACIQLDIFKGERLGQEDCLNLVRQHPPNLT